MRLRLRTDLAGRLVRRYQRFFADVVTNDGRTLTVHCPNPGSMLGCAVPGAAVRCSTSDNPRRRLRHTLEMVRHGRTWVGVNTLRANALAAEVLQAGGLPPSRGYAEIRREVRAGRGSRLDFRLDGHRRRRPPLWIEVKSVTLAACRVARFPDSVTERGRRHAEVLAGLARRSERAALWFLIQRADCDRFEPADDIDPAYGGALRAAANAGVEIWAWRARVTPTAIALDRRVPARLS